MPPAPPFAPPGTLRLKLQNRWVNVNTWLYRRTGGRVGGRLAGAPILLLDHVGRKSGQARTAPLMYTEDGDDLVVVASRAGSDHDPAWWLNLQATPATTVQIGRERRQVLAHQATAEERERLWPIVVANYRDYAVYEQRTTRAIPVIVLSPARDR